VSLATILSILSVVVAVISLLGGPLAAHVAVRVGLATLNATVIAKFDEIARRLDKMESSREADGTRISALEALDAAKEARIQALERTVRTLAAHITDPPPSSEDGRG